MESRTTGKLLSPDEYARRLRQMTAEVSGSLQGLPGMFSVAPSLYLPQQPKISVSWAPLGER